MASMTSSGVLVLAAPTPPKIVVTVSCSSLSRFIIVGNGGYGVTAPSCTPTLTLNDVWGYGFSFPDGGTASGVARLDQIIGKRLDRKGIVHTVSYARRDWVLKWSKYSRLLWTHAPDNTEKIVEQFKRAAPPAVLVSPSLSTIRNSS